MSGEEQSGGASGPEGATPGPEESRRKLPDEERAAALAKATGGATPVAIAAIPRTIVPRWVQLALLPISLLALWGIAHAAGKVLVIFIVASLIGLILNPAVSLLQRRLPRGLAVLAVYLLFFVTLAGIGLLLANPVSNQVQVFAHKVPQLIREAEQALIELQHFLHKAGLHVKLIGQGKTALQTLKEKLEKSSSSLVSFGGGLLTEAAGAIVDLVLVFVLSVYMLIYGERIGRLVRQAVPKGQGGKDDDYPYLVQRAVSRYVGGQLLFSILMGTTAGLALYVYGVLGIFPAGRTYAVAFGAFLGFMELIPYIGPILGAVPPILVALFTEPVTAIWVMILFLGIQQLEGHVVAPQIFGHTLRINPLLVMFGLLFGEQIYGLIGALLALPILAVLRATTVYLNKHVTLEPWERSRGGIL